MDETGRPRCRWCGAASLPVVLDLGTQPPADLFPPADAPVADPTWPLRMACCTGCGLAQLVEDPGIAEEVLGVEPQALVDQATDAVAVIGAAGLLAADRDFVEFDSPHGGSWRPLLTAAGCPDRTDTGGPAALVVDVFGLMHDADQAAALAQRVARLAPDGTLLLQFHSLASIVAQRQWNALRHGHMAYYSTRALASMLAGLGLTAYDAWTFELYGGTVLLAATRDTRTASDTLQDLLDADDRLGLTTPEGAAALGTAASADADDLAAWLAEHRRAGRRVVGYGAASRAVPLLVRAGVDATLLPAVADGSPAKRGRALPVSRIPIVAAADLPERDDDIVLLFVPDLLDEVRRAFPQVEQRGGRWAVSEPRPRLVPPLA